MTTEKEKFEEIRKRRQSAIATHEREFESKSKIEKEIKDIEKRTLELRDQITGLEREKALVLEEADSEQRRYTRLKGIIENNTDTDNVELMLQTVVEALCRKYRQHGLRMRMTNTTLVELTNKVLNQSEISLKAGRAILNISMGAVPVVPYKEDEE